MPLPQAMLAVLEAALEAGPLVLVVDVAQWVDSLLALIAALRDLPRARLGLVFAVLANPPRTELDELRRHLGHAVPGAMLSIGPLDATALRELAVWALPTYDAVALERVSRRVASDSAGLPILAVELLSAVAQGLDLQGPSAWPEPLHTLTQSLPGQLPDTVVAAVRVGFRRLSLEAQQVLSAAAVLDDRVTERLLARVTGQQAPALQAALDELEWKRWLEADGQGSALSRGWRARSSRVICSRLGRGPGFWNRPAWRTERDAALRPEVRLAVDSPGIPPSTCSRGRAGRPFLSREIRMRLAACGFALLLTMLPSRPARAQSADREVMAVVQQLFDAMRVHDTVTMRAVLHPMARLTSAGATVSVETTAGWLTAVARGTEPYDERIRNPVVKVDGGLASVWVEYAFYVGERFSHCGVDAFHLVRTAEGWRIVDLADTRRKDGCTP